MPCDSISRTDIDLGKVDPGHMLATLRELGLSPRQSGSRITFGNGEYVDTSTGEARVTTLRDVAELKQAYGAQIVKATAKKYGWQLQPVAGNKYAYDVIKR